MTEGGGSREGKEGDVTGKEWKAGEKARVYLIQGVTGFCRRGRGDRELKGGAQVGRGVKGCDRGVAGRGRGSRRRGGGTKD